MADLLPDLTAGQLTDFRQNWIRDSYTASPFEALSEYNRSRKVVFFSDTQLQSIYDRVITEYAEELSVIQYEKENERVNEGDVLATATIVADALREEAIFRLMRARARRMMLDDPGFRATMISGQDRDGATAITKTWENQSALDIMWVRSRAGWQNSIEVERT